jgi:hypothetical protein
MAGTKAGQPSVRKITERAKDHRANFTTPREPDATDARRLVSFAEDVRTGSESRTRPAQPWSKMQDPLHFRDGLGIDRR